MSARPDTLEAVFESKGLMHAPARRLPWRWLAAAAPVLLATLALADATPEFRIMATLLAALAVLAIGMVHAQSVAADSADTVVLVGRGPLASIIASTLIGLPSNGGATRRGSRTVLRAATLVEAVDLVRSARCDEVIVAGPTSPMWPELVDARGQRPRLVGGVEVIERTIGRVPLELIDEDRRLSRLGRVRSLGRGYGAAKRGLDLVMVLGLGLAILPVLPLIALAIRLDSPGPVFYRQRRVGLGGEIFWINKFRTMRQDAERQGAVWATEGDARITRVGRFMRLTRIDELPQLWNVLRGEMTLVGPRPERPEFTTMLAEEIAGYDKRHALKPGLTGWAQVCYRYASSVRDTKAKVEYDLYYVKHASLLLDLKIMARTVAVVVGMRGR